MKAVLLFSLSIIILSAKAWPVVKNPFEMMMPPRKVHILQDCMHVTSEDGDFIFKKTPSTSIENEESMIINEAEKITEVCGLYIVGEPNQIVQITIEMMDVSCESGGLMAFIDGWELKGKYFPGIKDHSKPLDKRFSEFCNDHSHWPISFIGYKKVFRSSQNAALLQYRIPVRGSFKVNVQYRKNTEPCNIMVQDEFALYSIKNFGEPRNCTITAIFPAVITVRQVNIGPKIERLCHSEDHLQIGGSTDIDSSNMLISSDICGHSDKRAHEEPIFCDVTTVRLISSGKYNNEAVIGIRKADENDISKATVICPL